MDRVRKIVFVGFDIENPEIKHKHGINGRKYVIDEFEYDKFRTKHMSIINMVLAK